MIKSGYGFKTLFEFNNFCRICKKKFKNIKSLGVHISRIHNGPEKYYSDYICKKIPACKVCGNKVKFVSLSHGYQTYCSIRCKSNCNNLKEEIKKTCLEKYGVESSNQSAFVKEKKKETFFKKFNVENISQLEKIKNKKKKTCLKNHGVEHPGQSEEVKQKSKETCLKRYGVEYTPQLDKVKEKIKETCLEKYGVDNPFKSQEIKLKIKYLKCTNFLLKLKEYLRNINIELIDGSYQHAHYYHKWKCLKCNSVFKKLWNTIQQGYQCSICHPIENTFSIQEKEITNFIKIIHKGIVIENSRDIIPPKELDIYVPELKVAIEYNGIYWHSDEVLNDPKYHLNKTEECQRQGIQLIHIFEDEWLCKQEIVKSRLCNILKYSNYNKKIHARKCIIKEITPCIKNVFLERNHIQGKDNSTIKLGAFYENELVSVMTFSKGNISKGSKAIEGVWELNRFCSKLNYHIPGMASKLLSYFKKNYNWEKIFSYADRRWSAGNVYEKLGFELSHITKPNYWYTKGIKRLHRFGLRKKTNEPKDIPEWILRSNEGYSRIYDCGNIKFEMLIERA